MENDFDKILDECINRINRGESLESYLADYPGQAKELEPLLKALAQTRMAYSFTPSEDARRAARQRLLEALEKRHRPSIWQRILAQRTAWATAATVVVILLLGYLGFKNTLFPGNTPGNLPPGYTTPPDTVLPGNIPVETIPGPDANGNFVFLVSDEVNAIADFSSLMVTLDRVSLLKSGSEEKWLEFVPETRVFDLTTLPGELTRELWRGDVPEGNYSRVMIHVSSVEGTLKSTGETLNIRLPGNKLHLSLPFSVYPDEITSFVFDLTVINTGNAQGGEKYQLKPQAVESGATRRPAGGRTKVRVKEPKTLLTSRRFWPLTLIETQVSIVTGGRK